MNIWCWLIPLLTGLICGIIGYYWGKGNAKIVDNSAEIKVLEGKNTRLQADLEACNKKLSKMVLKHGKLFQKHQLLDVKKYWILVAIVTESMIQGHGQDKPKWPIKENGSNLPNGKTSIRGGNCSLTLKI